LMRESEGAAARVLDEFAIDVERAPTVPYRPLERRHVDSVIPTWDRTLATWPHSREGDNIATGILRSFAVQDRG